MSRFSRAGEAVSEAVHQAGDTVSSLATQAQKRAAQAGEVIADQAHKAWPEVHRTRNDMLEAGRRLTRTVSRRPDDPMLWALGSGLILGYTIGWLIHHRRH